MSQTGSWGAAAVGLPDPGVVAVAELGIDLRRVVFVPYPGSDWAEAAGDLLSGVDVVLVRPPGRARLTAARHLSARARERQTALVVLIEEVSQWPEGGDLALSVAAVEWEGHRPGTRVSARAPGRGVRVSVGGDQPVGCRSARLWLPNRFGERWRRHRGRRDGSGGTGPGTGPEAA